MKGIKAEWHFFATSHGKNACDGVGGTIKRLAARASLQRPISNQILTPLQLFEFANKEIPGVTTFYIDSNAVSKVAEFLEPRFSNAPKFKGTRKNHQFVPSGNNVLMRRVSGGSEVCNLVQQNVDDSDMSRIIPGSYYACRYDSDWYFGIVNYVSVEHLDVNVKFLHPKGPATKFFWPSRDDVCWIPINYVICQVEPPSAGSTARFYSFDDNDVIHAQQLI